MVTSDGSSKKNNSTFKEAQFGGGGWEAKSMCVILGAGKIVSVKGKLTGSVF